MKATDIFSQRIIAQNDCSFNYENLFNSGILRDILKDPKSVKWVDVQVRDRKNAEHHSGILLMIGADLILPLVFLHNALIARLIKDAQETEVTIWPGIRGDVVTDIMENWEADGYIEDLKSIYNLHFDLTRAYYKRHIEKLSDEECKKLLAEVEGLEFTVAFLK